MGEKRPYIKLEDYASPMVSLEAIIITSEIEAHEGKYVATINKPLAYLHTDSDEEVIMILKLILEDLFANIDPKLYRKCFVL